MKTAYQWMFMVVRYYSYYHIRVTIFGWINIYDIHYHQLFDVFFLWIPRVAPISIADEVRGRLMDS